MANESVSSSSSSSSSPNAESLSPGSSVSAELREEYEDLLRYAVVTPVVKVESKPSVGEKNATTQNSRPPETQAPPRPHSPPKHPSGKIHSSCKKNNCPSLEICFKTTRGVC